MILRPLHLVFAAALLAGAALAAEAPQPLELRRIMQDLGRNMQTVVDGISREDWVLVERTAPRIADHPEPPAEEKARLITYLGAEAARFRGYDRQSHDAAEQMGAAAKRRDGAAVIAAFAKVQESCLGCHESFRGRILANFYGPR